MSITVLILTLSFWMLLSPSFLSLLWSLCSPRPSEMASQSMKALSPPTVRFRSTQVTTIALGMKVSLFRHGIRAVTPDCDKRSPSPLQVLARGMGLQMAMVGRRTKFTLYLNNSTTLDLVVEIKNEEGDYCSHRITNRSPLRSRVLSKQALKERHNIPLEYEVSGSEVRVAWIPLQEGRHTLSIIWRGQHVVGSPYSVVVDDSQVRL
ncbi:uncharacterized protein LOC119577516 [Penaeus monodon]|uniref:uncharacterized protein LOC119577516 n=1 Tax=Penaeus monodon TaxID=6687 RepID=UPI0018A78B16|nr:uncharacterized protein LOC119577516 [Penaeus monodon]